MLIKFVGKPDSRIKHVPV